ncbi:MAG: DUF192 domain-containing protein [Burkholderiales bacterium]|nr:DUF192 domain-containing protein [Burkholderiales bacterium]
MVACIPVDINHNQVCVETAKTLLQQSQGLAGRKSIKDNYAMLFDMRSLGTTSRAFWTMQSMKFPLDMVFIKDNKIITIMYGVKPCNYDDMNKCQVFGGFPVEYVIETKAGNANKWGLHISQHINFVFLAQKKMNLNKKS